tara:strand:+ start:315 stop:1118 length:804 start_codon:yes stop_codon:yes gene_type:complete
MNFYERNKEKLFFLFVIFFILTLFFPQDIKENISDFFSGLPTGLTAFLIVICIYVFASFAEAKRSIELEEYAEKHNYDFYKKPDETQISLFKEFKSIKTISNRDIFFNLLVPKDDNHTKPLIVTGESVFGGAQSSWTYNTQIFLYKHNVELPKFYIQRKTMLNNVIGRRYKSFQVNDIEPYKFKKKEFPHSRYFFFSEHPDIEDFISNEFIELLKTGINRKKALINIESNGKNLIFYKQWSRHTTEYIDYYSNLFKALKESLVKGDK